MTAEISQSVDYRVNLWLTVRYLITSLYIVFTVQEDKLGTVNFLYFRVE